LSENSKFEEDDFRSNYFAGGLLKETVRRAKLLEDYLVKDHKLALSLPEAALKFCLSFPEVSVVIPGMRKIKHVQSNIALAHSKPFEKPVLEKLRSHAWKRNL
jgi:aryl-alcohol dehydrogenase-like predicted oxidoreductase